MSVVVTILTGVTVAMPIWYSWRVWRLEEPSRAAWATTVAEAAVIVALVLVVGRWDIAGLYTRWVLLVVFLAALVRSSWRPVSARRRRAASFSRARLVSLALMAAVLAYVLHGLAGPARPVDLAFPLTDGRFMVGQGGGNRLLNHHAGHPEQRYAVDITAIGPAGFRADGSLPADPARYAIWGAAVVSPCAGEVLEARGDLPDLAPPEADPEHLAGNHVVLDCGGPVLELAHLMQNSVSVRPGQTVAAGDPVGRVGNTGNTTEPHLHIHAFDPETGAGLPVSFAGHAPFRNRVYRR